ncbi:flagellar motor switch phosphatase FliY [Evansella sp. AB-P1]|uniref:flagellar motor switch phosphatase FliY n=1 Tax=Evansella sp. AB-P1 TaxID=3037653 RepID=UPI00241E5A1E|nr:flagellar motor switch phosphatase FliY [Evansella sp. AB-P1]MDG5788180.1 flagellar motor switch phosphatase FliY [Evansella sp. AB-P1]
MNGDMLSQEEINALLNGMNDEDTIVTNDDSDNLVIENYLSEIEQDALGEIGNISFGSSATALSTLLNQKVDITTPKLSVLEKSSLENKFPRPHVVISVEYTEGFEGLNLFVMKTTDAAIIADLMLGNDGTNAKEDLGELEISAVQEAMNQMMGSASTSMSTIFSKRVDISPPDIDLINFNEASSNDEILPSDNVLVEISFDLKVGSLIDSKIMQLVTVSFAKDLVHQLMNPSNDEEEEETTSSVSAEPENYISNNDEGSISNTEYSNTQHSYSSTELDQNHQTTSTNKIEPRESQHYSTSPKSTERASNVQPAAFSNFETPSLSNTEAKNLDMLLDIPLEVTVELGRTKRSIKDILELSQGSIIELDKLAGEPVDILVNQKLIAKGEVVVIDENFGVRVTDIVSQRERISQLR